MLNGSQRLLWLSDTHLNSIPFWLRERYFTRHVNAHDFDSIVITGDISTGKHLKRDLIWLTQTFQELPIYYVLGNHDYYGRGFQKTHHMVQPLAISHPNLTWLTETDVVSLSPSVALVGHEGWYSASFGNPLDMKWALDWFRISEMQCLSILDRIAMFGMLASQSALHIRRKVMAAVQSHDTILIATHFPPHAESTSSIGRFRDFWMSYRTNVPMGDVLLQLAEEFPHKKFIVLAGHTHIPCSVSVRDNLEFHVGTATSWSAIPEKHLIEVE